MPKYRITIFELNSRGKEQITDCKIFDNRLDAEEFIVSKKAEPKPYKIGKNKAYFEMSGI